MHQASNNSTKPQEKLHKTMGSCSAAVVDTVEGILVAGILVVGILVAGNPEEDILEERIAEEVLLQVALLDYNNSSFTKFLSNTWRNG